MKSTKKYGTPKNTSAKKKRKARTQRKNNRNNLLPDRPVTSYWLHKGVLDIMGFVPLNVLMEHLHKRLKAQQFEEEKFKEAMSDTCAGCGTKIKKDWGLYQVRGNWCPDCSIKSDIYSELDNKISNLSSVKEPKLFRKTTDRIEELKQTLKSRFLEEYKPFKQRMRKHKI